MEASSPRKGAACVLLLSLLFLLPACVSTVSREASKEGGKEKGRTLTLDGAILFPLLAVAGRVEGKTEKGTFSASGYASPYLSAGSESSASKKLKRSRRGASLLPWVPFISDMARLDLYARSFAETVGGSFGSTDFLTFPRLGVGLFEGCTAGIESDTRFLDLFGISLYRSATNLPGTGFRPWLHEEDAPWLPGRFSWWPPVTLREDGGGRDARLARVLGGARSGVPVDHTGLVDPMITLEHEGEAVHSFGVEPLFFYGAEEGFSLPLLGANLSGKGFRFGDPALRHLFPLLHGNGSGTRWDFLCNVGTVYSFDDYSAVDLKLLFNWQHRAGRGTAWSFFPYFFTRSPKDRLEGGARFVQPDGHVVNWWSVDGEKGFEVLYPFLFFTTSTKKKRHVSALLGLLGSYRSEAGSGGEEKDRLRLTVGPFGFPFYLKEEGENFTMRILGVFGYASGPREKVFDFLGLPIVRSKTRNWRAREDSNPRPSD